MHLPVLFDNSLNVVDSGLGADVHFLDLTGTFEVSPETDQLEPILQSVYSTVYHITIFLFVMGFG